MTRAPTDIDVNALDAIVHSAVATSIGVVVGAVRTGFLVEFGTVLFREEHGGVTDHAHGNWLVVFEVGVFHVTALVGHFEELLHSGVFVAVSVEEEGDFGGVGGCCEEGCGEGELHLVVWYSVLWVRFCWLMVLNRRVSGRMLEAPSMRLA